MDKTQKQILHDLKHASEEGIKLCLLKDYIKEKNYADIDILTPSKTRKRIHKLLSLQGYETYHKYNTNIFYHKLIENEVVRLHLHFDYFFEFLHVDKSRTLTDNGIPILAKEEYAASLIRKIHQGRPKEKYLKELANILPTIDKERLSTLLKDAFSEKSIRMTELLDVNLKLKKKIILRKKIRELSNIPKIAGLAIKTLFKPFPFVVFMGVDGSGKTTTLENISEHLKKRKFRIAKVYGGRFKFRFLPLNFLVSKVAEKKKKEEGQNKDVITYKSKFIHNVTPFVYYTEYLLRYLFTIFAKRRLNNFVFADRSFIDVIISPNTNSNIAKKLYSILPKPSKVIYLHNNLETLIKRRNDHPKEDLKRQLEQFDKNKQLFHEQIRTTNQKETLTKILQILFKK